METAGITAHGALLQESEELMGASDGLCKLSDAAHAITDYIVGYYSALRRTNIMVGYHQTNQKTDTGKT